MRRLSGVEVSGAVCTLYNAGQIGHRPDGIVPEAIEEQTRTVYANMKAVLDAAGMSFADIVKTPVFLVNPKDRAVFSNIRSDALGGSNHASTMVYVAGLALPELLVEVEAIAAKQVTGQSRLAACSFPLFSVRCGTRLRLRGD